MIEGRCLGSEESFFLHLVAERARLGGSHGQVSRRGLGEGV